MIEKRPLYKGYKEYYMTGEEIYNHFKNCYECFGKHHTQISSYKINFKKYYAKILEDESYRLFINENFCLIMDASSDKKIYFFGYTFSKQNWAKD